MDRTAKRRVSDVDQCRAIHPGRRGRDRLSVRCLFHVSARYVRAARRPGRRPRRGSGVQLAAAPPRLCHPFRAGCLGGNSRPDKRHKSFAPARALGSRCFANPFPNVWRAELLPSVRALAGHASETGLHCLRSRSHAHLTVLSGLHRAAVRRWQRRTVSRRDLFPAAVDLDFQHGARVRDVESIYRFLRSRRVADLSPVPGRLPEMRPVLFLLVGNYVRRVAVR